MQLTYVNPPMGYTRPPNEQHSEFPKFVQVAGKPAVIANSAAEEASILAGVPAQKAEPQVVAALAAPVAMLVGENDEEAMLRKIAAEKGIRIDGRWKLPKIRKAVEAASQ